MHRYISINGCGLSCEIEITTLLNVPYVPLTTDELRNIVQSMLYYKNL